MTKTLLLLTLFANSAIAISAPASEAVSADRGTAGLARMLKRLQTTASVMHVVAHPDDEDGALLTYYARGLGVRTMLFSITRGEGGANLISSDFFDKLGALRTLEHLQSASYYGNELFYSHAADYGYSKNLDEANRKWQQGRPILADLTEVVRRERPTVILSRFRGDANDGHGHHQMAGVISQQVFHAAADRELFPDQLVGDVQTWQVSKLYTNNIRPQWRAEDAKLWTISIPTGDYDPLLGMSYAQLARHGLGFQRSQGISGHASSGGRQDSYYRLAKSTQTIDPAARETDLFAGLDTTVSGLAKWSQRTSSEFRDELVAIEKAVVGAVNQLNLVQTDKCVPPLIDGLKATRRAQAALVATNIEAPAVAQALQQKEREFEQAIQLALAMELESWATGASEFRQATPGQTFETEIRLVQRSSIPIDVRRVVLHAPAGWQVATATPSSDALADNDVGEWKIKTEVGLDAEPTRQPWQRESIESPFYEFDEQHFRQRPLPAPPLVAQVDVRVMDEIVRLERPVQVRFRDPELGQVRRTLTVVPAVSVRFPIDRGIMPSDADHYDLDVIVRSDFLSAVEGDLHLRLPKAWRSAPPVHHYNIAKEGEEARFTFRLSRTDPTSATDVTLRAVVSYADRESSLGFQTISARDLGQLNLFREATHRLRVVDVQRPLVARVGYIMGSGDDVPQALGMLGIRAELLSADDLADGNLNDLDVILAGVRAYAVRSDLRKHNQRLLDYVKQGGVFIVQYQTPEFDNDFGPYSYKMGPRPEEVSEEDAIVAILEPAHPVFHIPNRITANDFDGWVEQRGSKFLSSWDDRYTALLECHDDGQLPQRGGMLIAPYGSGHYVYSAYAWYRQLLHGVPGAYRIMSNLLSIGRDR